MKKLLLAVALLVGVGFAAPSRAGAQVFFGFNVPGVSVAVGVPPVVASYGYGGYYAPQPYYYAPPVYYRPAYYYPSFGFGYGRPYYGCHRTYGHYGHYGRHWR